MNQEPGTRQVSQSERKTERSLTPAAERAAVDAAVAMRVTMNEALDPIVRRLDRVMAAGRQAGAFDLMAYASPDGVTIPGAAWIVTAQAV